MKIAIIGGGIMGISLAYFLSQQGMKVEIFEASPVLGGLAGPIMLDDGTAVDRFYHAILPSDDHLYHLCKELDIADRLRFRETKMGFFHDGRVYAMNSVVDFLKFPPLCWLDRVRLGMTVLYAQFVRDWQKLETISVEAWLSRISGRRTYETIWRPMLQAKFDGGFTNIPATYMWARLVRTKSTRAGANQKEAAGHLIGGYITLIKAMAEQIEAHSGRIYLNTPIEEIVIADGRARGILVKGEMRHFDAVVATVQVPIFQRLIPRAPEWYNVELGQTKYLGIIAPLLVLDRPLTGYWTLNITDEQVPFTGVIETTTYIDPKYVGGHHLVYLPKYTAPGSHWQQMSDEEIRAVWLGTLTKMFPHFEQSWIRYFLVHHERYVEPLHLVNGTQQIPEVKTPVTDLYLATTAQIYPALTNGESVSRHARHAAEVIVHDMIHVRKPAHILAPTSDRALV